MTDTTTGPSQPTGESSIPTEKLPPTQEWTVSGYPIVDGQYLDMTKGQVLPASARRTAGPPAITVLWINIWHEPKPKPTDPELDDFMAMSFTAYLPDVTEYIARIGEMCRATGCKIHTLNVTRFAVTAVVETTASLREFREGLKQSKLIYAGNEFFVRDNGDNNGTGTETVS
jgi:hypothetical protein